MLSSLTLVHTEFTVLHCTQSLERIERVGAIAAYTVFVIFLSFELGGLLTAATCKRNLYDVLCYEHKKLPSFVVA